jgi:hypothetical protein
MTNRPHRHADGHYHIKGQSYKELFGSRAQVWNKTAYKTSGGLTRAHLTMNKWGRIVSALKHKTAKKEKRLQKYGFYAKKGKFGVVTRGTRKMKWSRSKRGGNAANYAAAYGDNASVTTAARLMETKPAPMA